MSECDAVNVMSITNTSKRQGMEGTLKYWYFLAASKADPTQQQVLWELLQAGLMDPSRLGLVP